MSTLVIEESTDDGMDEDNHFLPDETLTPPEADVEVAFAGMQQPEFGEDKILVVVDGANVG